MSALSPIAATTVTHDELDNAYVALSQALTRVPREDAELFLSRLALLLMVRIEDGETVMDAIARAEASLPQPG